jgi:hypothetical protein
MALRDLTGIPGIPGVNPTASTIARLTTPGAMSTAIQPMPATVQPTLSPTAKYIADMQALMSGGIGKLSTGEKISALGQVLQAAGSRGATDPAAVLQNVRNQQMQKLNAQFQIAQLQKKTLEEEDFIKTLTPSERNMFAILDETGRRQFMVARQQGRELTDAEKKIQAAGIPLDSPRAREILSDVAEKEGMVTITGPTGSFTIRASDLGKYPPVTPEAAAALRADPKRAGEFDIKFGPGKSAEYLGGGSGNTTGGFR